MSSIFRIGMSYLQRRNMRHIVLPLSFVSLLAIPCTSAFAYPITKTGFRPMTDCKSHFLKGDSLNLRSIGRWPFGPPHAVCVSGNHLYLGSGGGIYVLDIQDPINPEKVSQFPTPGLIDGLSILGDHLYVADYCNTLRVIDILDPENPREVGHCSTLGKPRDVAVSDSYAYVAVPGAGLRIIDISDPEAPGEVGSWDIP